ncbi:MAG: hypothetical protein GY813_19385 [Halieaceae bacterium]|nr:hypothetical protein [Halieaceae bacterium]
MNLTSPTTAIKSIYVSDDNDTIYLTEEIVVHFIVSDGTVAITRVESNEFKSKFTPQFFEQHLFAFKQSLTDEIEELLWTAPAPQLSLAGVMQ